MAAQAYELLEYDVSNRVAAIEIDRPDKLNALNHTALDELEDALKHAEEMDDVRVVTITGAGRAFSAGYDFGDGDRQSKTVEDWLSASYSFLDTVYELDLPVIAGVDGYAIAGGCNLAIVADITIATERAEFGYPDVHMGVIPPRTILPFVSSSLKHARELFYTGKMIDAERARSMGFVNRTVPNDELSEAIQEEVEHIEKTPSTTVTLLKDMVNDIQETQGFRPDGKRAMYYMAFTQETEQAKDFAKIYDEEGIDEAVDWMNETKKP